MKFLNTKYAVMAILSLLINLSASVKADNITLISSDNKNIEITQDAARLSGTMKTLLEFSPEEKVHNISVKFNVLQKVVAILEGVYQELTQRPDGRYITQEVQDIVDEKLKDKKREIDFLFNVMNVANFLEIPFLSNAIAKILVQNHESSARKIITQKGATQIPLDLHVFLEKHLKLKEAGVEKELSLMDLIAQYYGTPDYFGTFIKRVLLKVRPFSEEGVELNFSGNSVASLADGAKLTSLYGINFFVTTIKRFPKIISVNFTGNYIQDSQYDFSFPEKPFRNLDELEKIDLNSNLLEILLGDFFQGPKNLKYVSIAGNKLKELPENIFKRNTDIEIIILSKNGLKNISLTIFKELGKLRYLAIFTENQLSDDKKEEIKAAFKGKRILIN